MPYIPPPPRPYIPPPPKPFIPPNFHVQHQQQQQRFHQQQRVQQQQVFHQQQRVHQQQLQNQQRLQQNLQMDHTRRQQVLQQQQQHFQRQQEVFRRQQQDQERIRQQNNQQQQRLLQDRLRREEDQRRQQQLLRNLQHTSTIPVGETGGTTVVHVAPGIQVELSGLTLNGNIEFEQAGAEANQPPFQPSAPPHSPGVPPQTYESPPPYQQLPQGVPPGLLPPTTLNGPAVPQGATVAAKPSVPAENRVVLKDGTQIVIQQEDEILFVGPTGVQMVVNCLPLYMPPEDAIQAAISNSTSDKNNTDSQNSDKIPKSSPKNAQLLRKAKSLTSILFAEIELSDEEKRSRSDDELLEDTRRSKKKKKLRMNSFGAHYSVQIHRQVERKESIIDETDAAPPVTHNNKDIEHPVQDLSFNQSCDSEKLVQSSDSINDKLAEQNVQAKEISPAAQENASSPQEPDEVVRKKPHKSPVTKSKSTGSAPELDDGSDPEDSKRGFEVNYLDTNSTLPRLKRSSGSVSFPQRIIAHVPAANPVIVEESSLSSQQSDNQPIEPTPTEVDQPDGNQEGRKDSDQVMTASENDASVPTDDHNARTQETSADNPQNKDNVNETLECEQQPATASNADRDPPNGSEPSSTGEIVDQAKPTESQDTPNEITLDTNDISSASVQQNTPPVTQELSADPLPRKEGASLAGAANTPPLSTQPTPSQLTFTLLPPSPVTMDGDYVQRSGWLTKLSHRKGMFGDKWQKRYFVLNRSWLYYFKKYGDSNPKGVIRLLPTGWSKTITQGTPRMHDAVVTSNDKGPGIMSVLRCLGVHRPNNFAASLSALLEEDGVAEAFRSQTVSVSNPQHASRTFYMTASSNEERDAWVKAINTNIQAFSYSAEALTTATKELKSMLRAVKSNMPTKNIPSLLLLLHTKREKIAATQTVTCSGNSH